MKTNIPLSIERKNRRSKILPIAGIATTGAAVTGVAALMVRRRNARHADPQAELLVHLSDMMTLNAFVLGEVEGHLEDATLRASNEERNLDEEIRRTLMRQNEELQRELESLGGRTPSKMKAAAAAIAGIAASMGERLLYRTIQEYPVSRMIRDDYTMLSAISVSQTMLHATARAMHQDGLAEITERHMRETANLIVRVSHHIPRTVVAELAAGPHSLDSSVADAAAETTRNVWASIEQ
jgi:hypothetical protein